MSDDPYVYEGTDVLRNKLDIRDGDKLEMFERRIAGDRAAQGLPSGKFDLDHLCAIHHHLFQDVYEWAGQIRTVSIAKGGSVFQPPRFIATGMADVHKRLVGANFLRRLDAKTFASEASKIIGDINYVHPFREGNGRTQVHYLKQLAAHAGHEFDLKRLDRKGWIDASIAAHNGDTTRIEKQIGQAITGRSIERDR